MEKLPAPRPQNISLCSPPQQGNDVGFYRKRCSRPVRSQLLTPPPGATLQARPETETSLVPLPGTQGSCSFSQEAIRISSLSSQLPPRAAEGSGLCPPPSQGRHSPLSHPWVSRSAAMTNYHALGGLNSHLFSHRPRGWESKIKCQQVWFQVGILHVSEQGSFLWSLPIRPPSL